MFSILASDDGKLGSGEIFWKDHYAWLKEQGYQLRPRYAPDWTPSWKKNGKRAKFCEDGYTLLYGQINDAIQISTGRHVAIKMIEKKFHPTERVNSEYLCSEALLEDKRNNCIPILEVLRPLGDDNDELELLVMPYLRTLQTPRFDTVGEVVQCVKELLEGLQFLHDHNVAHRDLNANNFLMDPEKIFPCGHHHIMVNMKVDMTGSAPSFTRTQRPSRYYIIDFGISSRYPPEETAPLERPILGGDKTVPEFLNNPESSPRNPFWTDIYYAGNLIKGTFLQGSPGDLTLLGYKGTEFLQPLVDSMTQEDPAKRPTINEAVKQFNDTVASLSTWKLRSRTRPRRVGAIESISHFISHWARKFGYIIHGTPPIPCP